MCVEDLKGVMEKVRCVKFEAGRNSSRGLLFLLAVRISQFSNRSTRVHLISLISAKIDVAFVFSRVCAKSISFRNIEEIRYIWERWCEIRRSKVVPYLRKNKLREEEKENDRSRNFASEDSRRGTTSPCFPISSNRKAFHSNRINQLYQTMSLLGIAAIGGIGHHMGKKHEQKKEGTESSYEEYLRVTYLLFQAKALAAAQQQQAMAYSYPPAPHYQQAHPAPPPPAPSRHATAPMLSAAEARSWRSLSELPPHCKNLTLTSSEMPHSHQKLPFFFFQFALRFLQSMVIF